MKKFCLFLALVLGLTASNNFAAVVAPGQESVPSLKNNKIHGLVKTVLYRGLFIPTVDLPQVDIKGNKTGLELYGNVKSTGIRVINLPAVEITAKASEFHRLPVLFENGQFIAVVNLPVIEIESEKTTESSNIMAIVTLPEIIITPDSHFAVFSPEAYLSEMPDYTNISYRENISSGFERTEKEWIYISLKNCGLTLGNKIICEISDAIPMIPKL